jgi:hypothetical protein
MRSMRRAGRLRSAVAALAVAGLAAGTAAVLQGGGSAGADPVELTLEYSCTFPLIGNQEISVEMHSDMPTEVNVGDKVGPFQIDAVTTVNEAARNGLRTVGATTLEGDVMATSHLSVPGLELPLQVPLDIPQQPVPATAGAFTVTANGSTPDFTFQQSNVGTGVISVHNLVLTLTPRTSTGGETGLGTFESQCTALPDQNPTMHTFQIKGSGSTTSTTGGSTSSTSTPSSTTSTTTPSSTTSTTQATTTTTRPTTSTSTSTTVPAPLEFKFDITGETFIKAANGKAPITGNIVVEFDLATGNYTSTLTLNPTQGSFSIVGFLPVTSDIKFEQTAPTTGTLIDGKLTSSSPMHVFLTSVNSFGLPIGGGPTCRTVTPATIDLATPEGEIFNPLAGGKLTGTYTLPGLNDQCGFLGGFISIFMAGGGNTLDLTLTAAQ